MILSYHQLRREVQATGVIGPIKDAQVNASSIDVRLGASILVERNNPEGLVTVSLQDREALAFDPVELTPGGPPFLLAPGQFILANTLEVFNLPNDLSAEFRLNSSAGRMGLGHALSVWADAGWHGSMLTLELHNITRGHNIALHYGDRIGQMIFHRHAAVPKEQSYAERGAYNGQLTAMPAQPAKGAQARPVAAILAAPPPAPASRVIPPWEES